MSRSELQSIIDVPVNIGVEYLRKKFPALVGLPDSLTAMDCWIEEIPWQYKYNNLFLNPLRSFRNTETGNTLEHLAEIDKPTIFVLRRHMHFLETIETGTMLVNELWKHNSTLRYISMSPICQNPHQYVIDVLNGNADFSLSSYIGTIFWEGLPLKFGAIPINSQKLSQNIIRANEKLITNEEFILEYLLKETIPMQHIAIYLAGNFETHSKILRKPKNGAAALFLESHYRSAKDNRPEVDMRCIAIEYEPRNTNPLGQGLGIAVDKKSLEVPRSIIAKYIEGREQQVGKRPNLEIVSAIRELTHHINDRFEGQGLLDQATQYAHLAYIS